MQRAISLGIGGWVRNLPDGRVEAVFEGEKEAVDEILSFCRKGPPGAFVEDVTVIPEPFKNEFAGFSLRR